MDTSLLLGSHVAQITAVEVQIRRLVASVGEKRAVDTMAHSLLDWLAKVAHPHITGSGTEKRCRLEKIIKHSAIHATQATLPQQLLVLMSLKGAYLRIPLADE